MASPLCGQALVSFSSFTSCLWGTPFRGGAWWLLQLLTTREAGGQGGYKGMDASGLRGKARSKEETFQNDHYICNQGRGEHHPGPGLYCCVDVPVRTGTLPALFTLAARAEPVWERVSCLHTGYGCEIFKPKSVCRQYQPVSLCLPFVCSFHQLILALQQGRNPRAKCSTIPKQMLCQKSNKQNQLHFSLLLILTGVLEGLLCTGKQGGNIPGLYLPCPQPSPHRYQLRVRRQQLLSSLQLAKGKKSLRS